MKAVPELRNSLPAYYSTTVSHSYGAFPEDVFVDNAAIAAGKVKITTKDKAVSDACERWLQKIQLDEQRRVVWDNGNFAYYDQTTIVRAAEELGYTALDLVTAVPQLRKPPEVDSATDAEIATGAVQITTDDRAVDAACERWLKKIQQTSAPAADANVSSVGMNGGAVLSQAEAFYSEHINLAVKFMNRSSTIPIVDAIYAPMVARAQAHAAIAQAAATSLVFLTATNPPASPARPAPAEAPEAG